MTRQLVAVAHALCLASPVSGQTLTTFQEPFVAPGTRLDQAAWTTELGAPSYLGRTQLADWISPEGVGRFVVDDKGAQLALSTYNPTGFSLYGTHARTLANFQPTASTTVEMTTRLQLTSLQPGLVYGAYLYRCIANTGCATHDEVDIELVTNYLQPGAPLRVQLNRYANEPLGAGHGVVVALPEGFDPLASHDWTIRWALNQLSYFVDGQLLYATSANVPQGPMHANVIAWGPESNWREAYSDTLQPVSNPAQARTFSAHVRSVVVRELSGPVPSSPGNVMASTAGQRLTITWSTPPIPVSPSSHRLTFYASGADTMSPATFVLQIPAAAPASTVLQIPTGVQGQFTVRVEAVSGGATSLPSPPATFFVGLEAPSAPTGLVGLVDGSALALAWRNPATGGVPEDIVLDVTGSLAGSAAIGLREEFQFLDVRPGTYTFSVRGTSRAGSSAASNQVTLTFPGVCSGAPLPPDDLRATVVGRVVTLSWVPAATGPAPTGFLLLVSGAATGSAGTQARTISGTVPPGTYSVAVVAQNTCGASAPSAGQSIVVP